MARTQTIPEDKQSKQLRYYHRKRATDAKYRTAIKGDLARYLRQQLKAKRYKAKRDGIPFDLDLTWLQMQPMQCAITGKMFLVPPSGTGPLTPSFDQRIPGAGYTKANTQLVCLWVNTAKGNWPEDVIRALIKEAAQVV